MNALGNSYLFGHNDIKVVLGLVDVSAHRDDAAHTGRVGLAGASAGSVHDRVLGRTEEVGRTTQTVQHTASHDAGRVGVSVNVNLNGRVHADDTQTADDLGRVGNLLGAKQELGCVLLPVVVEALEAVRREANRSGRGKVQVAAVEKVKEGILKNLGPDLQVLEVCTAGLYTFVSISDASKILGFQYTAGELANLQRDHQRLR